MVTTDLIQITKDFWLYLRPLPREIIHVWERKPDRWELQGPSRASVANMLLKFCYPDVSNWPLCIIYNLRHCSFQPCQKASPLEWTTVPNWPVLWEKITVESLSLNVSPMYKGSGNIDKAWEKKKNISSGGWGWMSWIVFVWTWRDHCCNNVYIISSCVSQHQIYTRPSLSTFQQRSQRSLQSPNSIWGAISI